MDETEIKTEEMFHCAKCGGVAPKGTGIERDGQLTHLCQNCLSSYYSSHMKPGAADRSKSDREVDRFHHMLDRAGIKFMRVVDTGSDTCPIVITIENLFLDDIRADVVFDFDPLSGNLLKARVRRG